MLPTRPSESSPPINPFIFPTGTVKLLATYKGQSLVGSVSVDALVLASPVWKKFLFPPWDDTSLPEKETEVKHKQIDCTEDDGEALLILLNIVHLSFDGVPALLEYSTLLQVAVLVDQYDCIKVVRPWLESWMKNEKRESLKAKHEGWLFISWVFGREETFSTLARYMVMNTDFQVSKISDDKADPAYELVSMNGGSVSDPMPPGILDSTMKCRERAFESLLDIPYSRLATLERAMGSSAPACSVGGLGSNLCDAALYGSIMSGLIIGPTLLYPRSEPQLLACSVSSVARLLSTIQVHHIKPEPVVPKAAGDDGASRLAQSPFTSRRPQATSPPKRRTLDVSWTEGGLTIGRSSVHGDRQDLPEPRKARDHSTCAVSMSASVASVLRAVESPILDTHRLHMQLQRGEAVKPTAEGSRSSSIASTSSL